MKYIFFYTLLILTVLTDCKTSETSENMKKEINSNWILTREKTGESYEANVPGCVHTDLLENKVIEDPFFRINEKKQQWIDKEDWSYSTEFEADQSLLNYQFIELNFEGLDTYADIYLNDSLILKADNMFREWNVDCKRLIKNGKNKLKIYFHSPITIGLKKLEANGYPLPAVNDQSENGELGDKKVSPFTRKAPFHYGWDWGPRFVTSGIWKPVYLKAWSRAKIENVQIIQNKISKEEALLTQNISIKSGEKQEVTIEIKSDNNLLCSKKAVLNAGENAISLDYSIQNPKLWWTKTLGEPNLYDIETRLIFENKPIESTKTTIGLRTIKLVQKPDEFGSSFYFELNGVPVFMKGANHIPNDIFIPRISREIYEREIKIATESNMNMIRVWGGGIYENDIFYELCDKHGILVWQDFMFACSMYPGNTEFLESIKNEAIDNVTRLRNHACIALWCGNNEIDAAWSEYSPGGWGWKQQYNEQQHKEIWSNYESIFLKTLPDVIKKYDPTRAYWPSSPMAGPKKHASYEGTSGDMHYWGVWHGKEPFSNFLKVRTRFMSEYGFQSFPELSTVQKYALPEDFDIESEVMASHQRSGIGNLMIKKYMSWYYKDPKDFESFLYVGQVLQAEGIKMAIEAHRRDMPYNMGSLYWQLNDCWPVASWSSMDYYGKWKALQYYAKKAYASVIVSPVMNDKEVEIYVVSDSLENFKATLKVELLDFEGNIILEQKDEIEVIGNKSQIVKSMNKKELKDALKKKKAVLNISLYEKDKLIATNLLYFEMMKDIELPEPKIEYSVNKTNEKFEIKIKTDKLAKNVYLTAIGDEGFFSDNYFDLLPGKPLVITYYPQDNNFNLENKLKVFSLFNSY